MAPYAKKCLDFGKKGSKLNYSIRNVPLCNFIGYERQIIDLFERRILQLDNLNPYSLNINHQLSRTNYNRLKTKKCAHFVYFNFCDGICEEYLNYYGDQEIKPKHISSIIPKVKYLSIKDINPYTKGHKRSGKYFIVDDDATETTRHMKKIVEIKHRVFKGNEIINPILVRQMKKDKFEIIDGFCRFMALKQLGFKIVECVIAKRKLQEIFVPVKNSRLAKRFN